MKFTIKEAADGPACVYFNGEISFPFNSAISDGAMFEFCGHWDLTSGRISISIGDYRRAEVTLWRSAPEGFIDGCYGWESLKELDAITADQMRDALRVMLPSILALSVPE